MNQDGTKSRSGALKALSNKASQGQWGVFDDRGTLEIGHVETLGHRPCIVGWPGFDSSDKPMAERRANAMLIVTLVNAFRAGEIAFAASEIRSNDLVKIAETMAATGASAVHVVELIRAHYGEIVNGVPTNEDQPSLR